MYLESVTPFQCRGCVDISLEPVSEILIRAPSDAYEHRVQPPVTKVLRYGVQSHESQCQHVSVSLGPSHAAKKSHTKHHSPGDA